MTLKTPKEQAATDLAILFSTDLPGVESVTYTPVGGSCSDIPAIVDYGENLNEGAESHKAVGTIMVKKSDVTAPSYKDTVVIGSDTWRVRNIKQGDGLAWVLNIYRDERPTW